MNQYWLMALLASWVGLYSFGIYTEHKFSIASQVGSLTTELTNLISGETKMVADDQKFERVLDADEKTDPCLDKPIPADIGRMLH